LVEGHNSKKDKIYIYKGLTFCNFGNSNTIWYMLKFILRLLLFIEVGLLSVGFYLKNANPTKGNFIVGIAVLGMAFILLPFFLFIRYKNKKLSQYMFPKDPIQSDKKDVEN